MFEKLFPGKTSDAVLHELAPFAEERKRYLKRCFEQGYVKDCMEKIAGVLLTAACALQARYGGLDVDRGQLEAVADRIEALRTEMGLKPGRVADYRCEFLRWSTRWLLFLGRLQGVAAPPRPYTTLLDDFGDWMAQERGLAPATLKHRRWHVGQFLEWLYGRDRRVTDLSLRDLDAYMQHLHEKGYTRVTIKIHTNAIRTFVRHAERREWCAAGIADALHGPHIYRQHGLPVGPSWEDVQRLIADAGSDSPMDLRDRAILLLLAVYGLRAGEVAGLRLDDIDWEHDRLTVRRPKQQRSQVYPIETVVGQAIIRYLKEARPRCTRRELFLTILAPVGPMDSNGLYAVVSSRMKRLGIRAPRRGPHSLRHACATHLQSRGLSLKEIGDHLGHRSLDSTRIYAKVDIKGLREVAAFDLGGLA